MTTTPVSTTTPTRVIDEIATRATRRLRDAQRIARQALAAHSNIHPRPLPGCKGCPPVPCPCGAVSCRDVADHVRAFAGAETTWREVAA